MKRREKVILITGASSGFGQAAAEYLAGEGHIVYGTSRSRSGDKLLFPMLVLDVTSDSSVSEAVNELMRKEERIDVLINNAGIAVAGSLEDTSPDEFRHQLETNLMGVHRMCRAVIPLMRKQRCGLIINISSIAGRIGIPFQSAYSAGKFALEGMTESMRMELKPFGISTVLIEPGDFHTSISDNRICTGESVESSVYYKAFRNAVGIMDKDERNGPDPSSLAKLISRVIKKDTPRFRYTAGPAVERLSLLLKKILPQALFEKMLMIYYGL